MPRKLLLTEKIDGLEPLKPLSPKQVEFIRLYREALANHKSVQKHVTQNMNISLRTYGEYLQLISQKYGIPCGRDTWPSRQRKRRVMLEEGVIADE